jgi:hypothetical protein
VIPVKRKSRLARKSCGRIGFWKIRKTPDLPPDEILTRLQLRPLDYSKYKRAKNGT